MTLSLTRPLTDADSTPGTTKAGLVSNTTNASPPPATTSFPPVPPPMKAPFRERPIRSILGGLHIGRNATRGQGKAQMVPEPPPPSTLQHGSTTPHQGSRQRRQECTTLATIALSDLSSWHNRRYWDTHTIPRDKCPGTRRNSVPHSLEDTFVT